MANETECAPVPKSTFMHAVGHSRNVDRMECQPPKKQYVAAMPTQAIRLTITWQCDMVVNPVIGILAD